MESNDFKFQKFLEQVLAGRIKRQEQDLCTAHYAFEQGLVNIAENGRLTLTSRGVQVVCRPAPVRTAR